MSPHLAACVRTLVIDKEYEESDFKGWKIDELGRLLSMVSNLRKLTLRQLTKEAAPPCLELTEILNANPIKQLYLLDTVYFPMEILFDLRLTYLFIQESRNPEFLQLPPANATDQISGPQLAERKSSLRTLELSPRWNGQNSISTSSAISTWISNLHPFNLCALTSLSISVSSYEDCYNAVWSIILLCANTLQILTITGLGAGLVAIAPFDLDSLPVLQHFRVIVVGRHENTSPKCWFSWFRDIALTTNSTRYLNGHLQATFAIVARLNKLGLMDTIVFEYNPREESCQFYDFLKRLL